MNLESMSYSLLSSVLGILIVFIALIALSAMMVLLKMVFDASKRVKTAEVQTAAPAAAAKSDDTEELDWLGAAAAIYLLEEEEALGAPSAAGWLPGPDVKTDPWAAAPILRTYVERS
ncbi:MAG: OadG family protein [Spirochaetales bacterium]|nr:OadG family protein [Spirochaetales bacterium]